VNFNFAIFQLRYSAVIILYICERYCSKLFILNENEHKQFLKKFFPQFFGSDIGSEQCIVIKQIIQVEISCIVKEYKWKDAHIAFGFYRTKICRHTICVNTNVKMC